MSRPEWAAGPPRPPVRGAAGCPRAAPGPQPPASSHPSHPSGGEQGTKDSEVPPASQGESDAQVAESGPQGHSAGHLRSLGLGGRGQVGCPSSGSPDGLSGGESGGGGRFLGSLLREHPTPFLVSRPLCWARKVFPSSIPPPSALGGDRGGARVAVLEASA